MANSTLQYFILGAYLPLGGVRYLLAALVLLLYVCTVVLNMLLVMVMVMERGLHQPMYVFLGSLLVNETYGSSGLLPFLMLQLPQDTHLVAPSFCFLQIFCLYTYAQVEYCNLALMAYDRYLAICCPLQYGQRMTLQRAGLLVLLVWLYSFLKFLVTIALSLRLTYCGNIINSVYCHNYLVAKLACSGNLVNHIYGLFGIVLTVLVPLLPILGSYGHILLVCFGHKRLTQHTRSRALATCVPHLVTLLNFTFGCSFEILQSRFDLTLPVALRLLLSLYFLLIQPLLTPLVYGLQLRRVRGAACRLLCQQGIQSKPRKFSLGEKD